MTDRALIEEIIQKTHPRIRALTRDLVLAAEKQANAMFVPQGPAPPLTEEEIDLIVAVTWGVPLMEIAGHLLMALAATAKNGECGVDAASLAAVSASLDDAELQRITGVEIKDIRTVLAEMYQVVLEMVMSRDIRVSINRQRIRFRCA